MVALPAAAQSRYEVTASKLNVRTEAKSNGAVMGSVKKGQALDVISIHSGWAKIKFKGQTGYVSAQYLTPKSSAQRTTTEATRSRQTERAATRSYRQSSSKSSNSFSSSSGSGLGMTIDLGLGYSKKVFAANISYDLGYQYKHMLYIGAGPIFEGDFSDGGSTFSAGAHAKLSFVFPLKGDVTPLLSARIGYLYNFDVKSGGLFYGGDLGICIKRHFNVGLRFNMTTATITEKVSEKYTYRDKRTNQWVTKSYKVDKDKTLYNFKPFVFFSYTF